ncbi:MULTISPECIES: cell division protein FtsA [Bacillaceae]|uniref:cell division protein FtsA n=1 Tax=Bacillaceae TaxID=186817 RepID=UPI000BFD334B|nr:MULTISPECIES: pilus assembly protein PilM [Bacillaceae]PGT91186.1 cell division protein [Bacillus sp. AFS040349]UGB29829.1 pilus assembly protein PilM [Metabacillus sp. B2-18]
MTNKDLTFALDIGTRSVVGLILKEENGFYHIMDTVIKEHDKRSMLDGQIHDVLSVANVITSVKEELEHVYGPLHKVCVAAAGRALKTERATISIEISGKPMIQKEDILHLELMAVQIAQKQLAEKHENERSHHYDCVGYSVLHYKLDGEEIGSLIDQQGEEASVDIIATFLPKIVVESLLAALNRANLEMEALTLEPIAAINVLIPSSMRRLNVALVDIGAGTSDIAITDMGTIISYGMVPIAGDEITEAVSDEFLLDFPKAEEAKRELLTEATITITDILGFEAELPKEDVITKISPAIDRLTKAIKDEILRLNNNHSPKAVMLVGGGSQTPELARRLAALLELAENRVAIRGIDAISQLELAEHINKGPELVTPIGIAVSSKQNPIQYISVKVNERSVRLFHMKALTVADSLLASGIQLNKLYGKPGMALFVNVNGQAITIPGEHGTAPLIRKNGENCSLEDPINHGDIITVENGIDGKAPVVSIGSILDEIPSKTISINGESYTLHASILLNDKEVSKEAILSDRDRVTCIIPSSIETFVKSIGHGKELDKLRTFSVKIDNKIHTIQVFSGKIIKNGLIAFKDSVLEDGDIITMQQTKIPTLQEFVQEADLTQNQTLPIIYNGKSINLEKPVTEFFRKDVKLTNTDLIYNGDELTTKKRVIEPFIFQDLFAVVDLKIPSTANSQFTLLRNNQEVNFQEPLTPGDELTIKWMD